MPDLYRASARPSATSRHAESTEPARIRVPADVERPDQVIAGLTARQAAILTVTAVVLWLLWQAVHAFVPPMVFLGGAGPVLATGTVLALGRRDGLSLDRYALAALRHARSGHRQVHAPEGVLPVPGFARTLTPTSAGPPAPVPAQPVAQGIDAQGVIDLGRDGTSVIGAVGTVNFALRTPAEQEALIGAFAGWLNSLPGPVQILIRADRADLTPAITALRRDAPALPHPALEAAAGQHADFLTELAATRDLLHRQVLLTHHHPSPAPGPAKPPTGAPGAGGRRRWMVRTPLSSPRSRTMSAPGRAEASGRGLHRRADDAARMLAGADVAVTALDGPTASALLAAACTPSTATSTSVPGGFSASSTAVPVTDEAGAGTAGVTPAWLHLGAQSAEVAGEHVATFAVTGYPSEVAPGWLEPVLTYPGRLDVALHIEPVPPPVAADRLRKQRARLESTRLITSILMAEWDRTGGISLRRFYTRRLRRLYPALLVMLAGCALFAPVFGDGGTATGYLSSAAATGLYYQDFVVGITGSAHGGFRHTWSLAVEEQFYLIWPPVLVLVLRKGGSLLRWALFGTALSWVLLVLTTRARPGTVPATYALPHARAGELLLGCALAAWLAREPRVLDSAVLKRWLAPVALAGVGLVMLTAGEAGLSSWMPAQIPVVAILTGGLITGLVADERAPSARVLSWAPLVWLGGVSYGIYLFHLPVMALVSKDVPGSWAFQVLLELMLTLVIAAASYRFVESPFLRRNDRGSKALAANLDARPAPVEAAGA